MQNTYQILLRLKLIICTSAAFEIRKEITFEIPQDVLLGHFYTHMENVFSLLSVFLNAMRFLKEI